MGLWECGQIDLNLLMRNHRLDQPATKKILGKIEGIQNREMCKIGGV